MSAAYDGPKPRPGKAPDPRRRLFIEALKRNDGNLTRTAKALGISRRSASAWWQEYKAGKLTRSNPNEGTAP